MKIHSPVANIAFVTFQKSVRLEVPYKPDICTKKYTYLVWLDCHRSFYSCIWIDPSLLPVNKTYILKYIIAVILFVLVFPILTVGQSKTDLVLKHGTTILTLVSPDSIWIAADSKISETTGNNTRTENSSSSKKIYKTNNTVYGFAAIITASTKSGESFFESRPIMECILKKRKSTLISFEQYKDSIILRLNQLLDTLILNRYTDLIDKYTKEPIHTFIMTSFENGKPYYFSQSYIIAKVNGDFKIQEMKGDIYDYGTTFFIVGNKEIIKIFLSKNQNHFDGLKKVKDKLVCLISLEAQKNPTDVGMPVNAIILNKKGYKWSLNNKTCNTE